MSRLNDLPVLVTDLRGGRNNTDPPDSLDADQCVEALNVDWFEGTLAHKRNGATALSTTFSAGGPFTGLIGSLVRHVPGVDETAAELWAFDDAGVTGRLAGAATWTAPTFVDSFSSSIDIDGLSFASFLFLAYNSTQNRLHLWDGTRVRRVGLATPDPPTVATLGGSGNTFTRYYRIRTVEISGSTIVRRSEASTVASITITDDSGVQVTRPTLPTNEHETHWEVEYADAAAGPFYRASQVATGTSTYDDTAATISTTNLTNSDGIHFPPPSAKYLVRDQSRLLMAGCWETSGGYTTASDRTIWWTPPAGALDVGDAERVPTGYKIQVEQAITAMGGPLDGDVFVFGYRAIWGLTPTTLTGANAYRRYTLRTDIGCIRNETIVEAEDEHGNPALYFLSHKGPYRIGSQGVQYCGNDVEDLWATVNLGATAVVGHGIYHADLHQIWWWIAVGSENTPTTTKLIFDTRLGVSSRGQGEGSSVLKGWAKHTSDSASARCSVMFSGTVGATMSRLLKPYIGQFGAVNRIWKCDTGTDDNGTTFQAYVDTKPYRPAGWGINISTTDPQLIAEAASGVTITVTPLSDYGLATTQTGTAVLTASASETRVQKRVEGLQAAGAGTIAFRIGDGSAAANAWTLDALIAIFHAQEPRS